MLKFIKSAVSFSMAIPLFGAKQVFSLLSGAGGNESSQAEARNAFEAVVRETGNQMGGMMKGVFKTGDKIQRRVVDHVFDSMDVTSDVKSAAESKAGEAEPEVDSAGAPEHVTTLVDVNAGRLDPTCFVVLGGSLSAGLVDFGLNDTFQGRSFAAQLAGQMGTRFRQPLVQPPGIGVVSGFGELPVILPANFQTTVLSDLDAETSLSNLSVPGLTLHEALNLRPKQPVIHRNDAKQTSVNLILGRDHFEEGREGAPATQAEMAIGLGPTFVLVELGFSEVLEAALAGQPEQLPDLDSFRNDMSGLLKSLKDAGSEAAVMTIPDPFDTAAFSDIESAARVLKVEPAVILNTYDLSEGDQITVRGLVEMGGNFLSGEVSTLPETFVLDAAIANQVRDHVSRLNEAIRSEADQNKAVVVDLNGILQHVGASGVAVGDRTLTSDFLGGFYSLNGYTPGPTGNAAIANEVAKTLNGAYESEFTPLDLQAILKGDPVADHRQAEGPVLNMESLQTPAAEPAPADEAIPKAVPSTSSGYKPEKTDLLKLPPGLEQVLPLNTAKSYFGDAIRAVNCTDRDDRDFGTSGELLFNGLAMTDSHLNGYLRITFSPPMDKVAHFEVRHGGEQGLRGDDGILTAPRFFRLPVRHNQVKDDPELVSSGDLNIETGDVTNLDWAVRFFNTALWSLVRVNPTFPDVPIQFPGMYGSAWAKFEQRSDGLLDFNFYGTTFVPLGLVPGLDPDVRFPMPFCSPTQEYASVPARGSSLHPHLHLSTKETEPVEDPAKVPDLPEETLQEFTLQTHNSSFGDLFTLDLPELGGSGKGRSHLLGRVLVQFGSRFGDSVSVAITAMNPGGFMGDALKDNPLKEPLPGSKARMPLLPGPHGHNEFLRFPRQTYNLNTVFSLDDPFDLSVGAVDLNSGELINQVLQRGLISQNLFFALVRVETRTPHESFYFRGPAKFEKGPGGETVYRYDGVVRVVYPGQYDFPAPNLTSAFRVQSDSTLDPFMWLQAMHAEEKADAQLKGEVTEIVSSTGERFSYRYDITGDPEAQPAAFEYTNHAQKGTFKLHTLSWFSFTNSRTANARSTKFDTVSFSGYGTWDKDGGEAPHQVSVQISESKKTPYVSIQIDGGFVSNVNTKPEDEDITRP